MVKPQRYNCISNKTGKRFKLGFRECRKSTPEIIDFEPLCLYKYPPEKIAKMMKVKRIKRMISRGEFAVSNKEINNV